MEQRPLYNDYISQVKDNRCSVLFFDIKSDNVLCVIVLNRLK